MPTDHKKIMVIKGVNCNLQALNGHIDELVLIAEEQEKEKIMAKLQEIIPEYKPS